MRRGYADPARHRGRATVVWPQASMPTAGHPPSMAARLRYRRRHPDAPPRPTAASNPARARARPGDRGAWQVRRARADADRRARLSNAGAGCAADAAGAAREPHADQKRSRQFGSLFDELQINESLDRIHGGDDDLDQATGAQAPAETPPGPAVTVAVHLVAVVRQAVDVQQAIHCDFQNLHEAAKVDHRGNE